jgi:hypothetical protein
MNPSRQTQEKGLQEILCGRQADRYGALPLVPLPVEGELALHFAKHLLEILKNKGIYRRGNVVVRPDAVRGCLEPVTPHGFVTWVEHHLLCHKKKLPDTSYHRLQTMSNRQAETVLACEDFWKHLPEIEALNPMRSLSIDDRSGDMTLLPVGYDRKTKTFTFA